MQRVNRLFLVCVLLSMTACSSVGYYGQSILGHNRIMWARQPVEKVISSADADLKQQLVTAQSIRQFATDRLALPDNKSYTSYVDLKREYPVWNVVAAQEFSVQAKAWCYPVIGCASYRGYFSKLAAQDYAANLESQGFETSVGGAIAYSTLGWFADPLLPSMMRNGDAALAENIFHELAHQVVYVNNNSAFNEAFASVVGEQGALRWLQETRPAEEDDYRQRLNVYNDFVDLLNQTKEELAMLYALELSEPEKRQGKSQTLQKLSDDYQTLKLNKWQGQAYFDHWFNRPINNARLASVSTYREHIPALQALFEACDKDFAAYFETIKRIAKMNSPDTLLQSLPAQC